MTEIEGGDFFQGQHEDSQSLEIFVAEKRVASFEIGMDYSDCAADVAHLVRDCGYEDPRAGEQVMEIGFFAITKILRCIDDDGCESRPGAGRIGGEPDLRDEGFAI